VPVDPSTVELVQRVTGHRLEDPVDLPPTVGLRSVAAIKGGSFSQNRCKEDGLFVMWCKRSGFKKFLERPAYRVGCTSNTLALWAEVEKYNKPIVRPTPIVMNFAHSAVASVTTKIAGCYLEDGVLLDLLTPLQAAEMMNQNTSPGYPWREKHHKKHALLGDPEASSILWGRVAWIWDSLKRPVTGFRHVWFAFLKEELRPVEKLQCFPPKIRSICGAPFDLSIVGNQICGDFNKQFYLCCEKPGFGSCVGVTPFHGGWNRLWTAMFANPVWPRGNGASLDVKQWDRSFSPALFEMVLMVRKGVTDLAGSRDAAAAARLLPNLYRDVICSLIAVPDRYGTRLVSKEAGMPSGWIGTTPDNTLGHIIVITSYLFSIGLAGAIGREVEFKLYGDDNLLAWADSVDHLIVAEDLKGWYANWGFDLHDVVIARGDDCQRLVFLGGTFGVCPRSGIRVYVPSEPQKGFDSMRFKFKSVDSSFERACAIRCLHFYNDEIYHLATQYAAHLLREGLVSQGLRFNFLSEAAIFHIHTGTEGGDLEGDGPLNATIFAHLEQIIRTEF